MQLYVGDGRKPFKIAHLYLLQGKGTVEVQRAVLGENSAPACAMQGAGMVLSLQASTRLEEVAALVRDATSPADACQAAGLGVAGLIVSNHGGRTLDTAVTTAQSVLVGHPAVQALAAGGAQGMAVAPHLLRDELEIAMALTSCRTLQDITPELVWRD